MEEQFCTYEISLALKELGYSQEPADHHRLGGYDKHKLLHFRHIANSDMSAPLWQQAIDWLREKYKIEISIYDNTLEKKYAFLIGESFSSKVLFSSGRWFGKNKDEDTYYKTFYEAREQAILKAISYARTTL